MECSRDLSNSGAYAYLPGSQSVIFSTNFVILLGEIVCIKIKVYRDGAYADFDEGLSTRIRFSQCSTNNTTWIRDICRFTAVLHKEKRPGMETETETETETVIQLPKPEIILPGFNYKIEFRQELNDKAYCIPLMEPMVKSDSHLDTSFHFCDIAENGEIISIVRALRFNLFIVKDQASQPQPQPNA